MNNNTSNHNKSERTSSPAPAPSSKKSAPAAPAAELPELPKIYKKHYKTGEDVQLTKHHTKTKLCRVIFNRYYKAGGYHKARFISSRLPRYRLIALINILCFKIRPDNPASVMHASNINVTRILEMISRAAMRKEDSESGGREGDGARDIKCPTCGQMPDPGAEYEPDWITIFNALNLDKYAENECE